MVSSPEDLSREVRPEELVEVRLRGNDEDGNLSYLMLIDENGIEIDREDCGDQQGRQCTVLLRLEAADDANEVMGFKAVAVDAVNARSEEVSLEIETERAFSGGGGGGGSSDSGPPPPQPACAPASTTPDLAGVPSPALAAQSGQGCVGQISSIAVILTNAPEGLAGFHIEITLDNPQVAEIADVEFDSGFGMTTSKDIGPASHAVLAAADILGAFKAGNSTNITLATLKIRGLAPGTTGVIAKVGPHGIQGDNGGKELKIDDIIRGTLTVN